MPPANTFPVQNSSFSKLTLNKDSDRGVTVFTAEVDDAAFG